MELVDLETWPRRDTFRFFSGLSWPFYSVTSTLDVGRYHAYVKAHGLSFYYGLIYLTTTVMDRLPDFLYKIRGGQIVRHDRLEPSFVTLDQQTHQIKITNVPLTESLEDYCARCRAAVEAQTSPFPSGSDEARDDLIYFSCTPWFSFTSLTNEMDDDPDDSIPRITWGKFEAQEGRLLLPCSVQLNHRLLDGWHLGQLLTDLQRELDAF